MFTGLIQKLGVLESKTSRGQDALQLTIGHDAWSEPLQMGESIAVQGICLTVSKIGENYYCADVLQETLEKTALGGLALGAKLNLERAMLATDRFGGHIVSGHVDGVGRISEIRNVGPDRILRISCSAETTQQMVSKGSITLEGISLTLTHVGEQEFEVHLIPVTWQETSLQFRKVGDSVNLETDVLAKYVQKYVQGLQPAVSGLSADSLIRAGLY